MKKLRVLSLIISVILIFSSCSLLESKGDVSNVKIVYGKSELFSKQDMDAAIEAIFEKFEEWDGCTLYTVTYMGDEVSKDNLNYCNDLYESAVLDECIVFESSFHTGYSGDLGFNTNQDYDGWTWYLARKNVGQWILLTYGYG